MGKLRGGKVKAIRGNKIFCFSGKISNFSDPELLGCI